MTTALQKLKDKHVVLTGGGTAGHVMPNLALAPTLKELGARVSYVGSYGHEQKLVTDAGIPFYAIQSGKLRRYLSIQNLIDLFKVAIGTFQAFIVLLKLKPDVIFSKGGFVAVPVCLAARVLRCPVVTHESDYSPGLANRIIAKFATKLLYSFPETEKFLPKGRSQLVLTPIRKELRDGDRAKGLSLCGFTDTNRPTLLIMGGSQGAQRLNDFIAASFTELTQSYQLIHLTGKGKATSLKSPYYKQFEFVGAELPHLFAATDIAICRAGANSIFELFSLSIPMLLVPLEIGTRGDQILNAKSFEKNGWADTMLESKGSPAILLEKINSLNANRSTIQAKQQQGFQSMTSKTVVECLAEVI
jgi:UDP-N-acetylglucosamine--N-acetylmuramyl-(pentapeptide) pyrophosphoryl-undecaprenol N-acetylglucosamine transferase